MTIVGTSHFVSIPKACDYYRDYDPDLTPAGLERWVKSKIEEGTISIGKPDLEPGQRLLLIDNGQRYAVEG